MVNQCRKENDKTLQEKLITEELFKLQYNLDSFPNSAADFLIVLHIWISVGIKGFGLKVTIYHYIILFMHDRGFISVAVFYVDVFFLSILSINQTMLVIK